VLLIQDFRCSHAIVWPRKADLCMQLKEIFSYITTILTTVKPLYLVPTIVCITANKKCMLIFIKIQEAIS